MERCRRCGDVGAVVFDGLCPHCLKILIALGEAVDLGDACPEVEEDGPPKTTVWDASERMISFEDTSIIP